MSLMIRTILSLATLLSSSKLRQAAACNGVIQLMDTEGIIESPGYKHGENYPTELDCTWVIVGPTKSKVTLRFDSFALEESKRCDSYDFVTIRERCTGTSSTSANLGDRDDGYCGKFKPPVINSTCNELHVRFRSDDSETASGFRARYKINKDSVAPMITCLGEKACDRDVTEYSAKATELFTFHCQVYGYPRPRRYWKRQDGKPLPVDAIDDNNGTLTIPSLRYPNDTGDYMCIANNSRGEDISTVHLEVIPKCACPSIITTNWYYVKPFVEMNENSEDPTGIFPHLITKMIDKCCGNCSKGHGVSDIRYETPKESLNEVKEAIVSKETVHLSFPIAGKEDDEEHMGYYYRPLFSSPGVAVLVMKEDSNESAKVVLSAVISAWPVLLLTLVMAWLAGIVMWALDTWYNPDEFPRPFHAGVFEGFWWAFVTMTTVGYGDRSPKGHAARAFAVGWILVGLVIISITTGVITSSLTAITLSTELRLYGAKVGALANSTEHRMGVKKNSDVKEFTDLGRMFSELESRNLDGILLDSFVAGANRRYISSDVRINKIVPYDSAYGIVFQGEMASNELPTCFDNYISENKDLISDAVENNTSPVEEPEKSAAEEAAASLFDASTDMFKDTLFSCIGMLVFFSACGLIWDYGYQRYFKKKKTEFDDLASLSGPGYKTVETNMKLLDTLLQEVEEFNVVWTEKLDEVIRKHDAEFRQFSQHRAIS